jgi:two-component system, sensor histidine kinase and response regulator
MDWRMPGIDGFETAKRIRKLTQIKQPRIVMITAYGQDNKLYDEELHLDAVLHKPVNESALFNTLQCVMLGSTRTPRKLYKNRTNPEFLIGFKILAVEDNPLNQQIILELLELSGAKVYEASNGNEALEWLENCTEMPDAILMDLQMPQLDGYETTRRLRKNIRFAKMPVFAMTADVLSGVYDKCLQAGMNDYISKPIDLEELYGKLGQYLNIDKSAFIMEQYEEKTRLVEVVDSNKLLNLGLALRQLGNDENLLMSILKRFQKDYEHIDTQIEKLLKEESVEAVIRFFHTLKATAGSIGSEHIHKSAEELEKMVSVRGKDNLEPLIIELKEDFKVLLNKIELVLGDYEIDEERQAIRIDFEELLQQLYGPLQNHKPAEIENILSQVDLEDFLKDEKELLIEIHNLCDKYRYKDALNMIEKSIECRDFDTLNRFGI